MTAFAHIVEVLGWSTPGDRASRDSERCKQWVAEIEGQS